LNCSLMNMVGHLYSESSFLTSPFF
jgi:hypothetical protein